MPTELRRTIGFWGGSAIMVGCIIGSGIFRTPATIAKETGSPAWILAFWLAGGVLSLFGALAYAELGTMFPRSGGLYVYLNRGLGGPVSFVFGWTFMLITKPMAAAAIAMVFAEHVNLLLGTKWDNRIVTCVMVVFLTGVNAAGTGLGSRVAVVLTGIKVLALAGIVGLGLALMKGSGANFAATAAPKTLFAALAPVMAAVLWTYDGWSDVAAVAGEVKEPQRTLPRVLLVGTAAVTAIYVAVNAVYLWMVPLAEMRACETVAPLVMERLLGGAGATAVTAMIVVSTLGATHTSILTGARVTYAQAADGLLFRFLGRVSPRFGTPAVSLWVQALLSCAVAWFLGTFERLAGGFVFTMWIFYGLAAVGVIVLRVRRPDLDRPYRCRGYPVVPVLFIAAAAAMTVLSILDSPRQTLPWLGVLVAGAPAYYLWRRLAA
ncbi:MAG: amino acid permease [Planctomycetes bacterium]|nr:amino acid permease [Planctomycetota bacterium]